LKSPEPVDQDSDSLNGGRTVGVWYVNTLSISYRVGRFRLRAS